MLPIFTAPLSEYINSPRITINIGKTVVTPGVNMIELRFVDGKGPVSQFIEFWTWGEWSHVDIKTTRGWLGARADGGVQIRPWNYCTYNKEEIRSITLTEDQEKQIMEWFISQIGKPYDFMAIIGMPFRKDWRDDNRWFCSELAMAGFAQAGINLLHIDNLNRVSPRDLYLSPFLQTE